VETEDDARLAWAAGWRTFRAMHAAEQPESAEVLCPASKEAGYRTQCVRCQLCKGTQSEAKSVAIYAHGQKLHFFRNAEIAFAPITRAFDSHLPDSTDVSVSAGVA